MTGVEAQRRKPYHHWNLRDALIETGLRLLESRSADELDLREVAREAGVTPTSIYRHFPDKSALMSALAAEGTSRLRARLQDARGVSGHTKAMSDEVSLAYVRFAQKHPALFRLACAYSGQSLLMISLEGSGRTAALRAWSMAHGLALLILGGQVRADDAALAGMIGSAALSP